MSRSFRDLLKFSAPLFCSAALLSGCGSGSSGSADLDEGGSTNGPPPPVTKTESFDFKSPVDWFVSGTPPTHARFSGGQATDTGAGFWIIPSGKTGVIDFGTPADAVKFTTQDDFTPTAAAGAPAQKTGVGANIGSEKVDAPFCGAAPCDTGSYLVYVRGLGVKKDWDQTPPSRQFKEVADNVLEVTLPLTTAIVANGEFEAADETGEFKVAAESWSNMNCGAGDAGARIEVGTAYTMSCGANPGNLDLTITEDADYKFTLDVTGSDKTAPVLKITKVATDGGGGEPVPQDSTIIRIHSVTVVASAAGPAGVESVTEVKGLGSLSIDEVRQGGDARITRIEIENTGTKGDIGVADISWTADAQFALEPAFTNIYYSRPTGSTTGTRIVVGGETYDCVATPADSPYDCVAEDVEVTPYANAPMTVQNAGVPAETINFNGGSGEEDVYAYSGNTWASTGTPAPAPVIADAAAHWVDMGTLLYNPPAGTTKVELLVSPDASIAGGPQGISGTYQTVSTAVGTNPKPAFNNQLHTLKAWALQGVTDAQAKDVARGQLVAIGRDANGKVLGGTRVQAAGALDALYTAAASDDVHLGVSYASGVPSLAVWAPTALKDPGVKVNIYDDAADTTAETFDMTLDEATGVWSVTGTSDWNRKFYTISLKVFSYAEDAIVTNEVTDPYSVSLAMDSVRSQFVDLNDADLKPAGWDTLVKPALEAPEDIVLYELHVRDFSVADQSVPAADRGKFTAFDTPGTKGREHLQQLAQAGLTHVHILPAFDIATVKENPADQVNLEDPVEKLCAKNTAAASLCSTDAGKTIRKAIEDAIAANQLERPPQIMEWIRQLDGFNWGYDPYHFGVPEGSYSTNPNGPTRILEFRRMVKGLNDLGLRTVMDVVYNHTNQSGQNPRSVLDKIVPGYYHRRDNTSGGVTSGTCCADTATEFRMMEKLMIDTGKTWVRDYKVSGFRFDLMGTHPLAAMIDFQDAVKAIDPSVYIYGEGWNCCGGEDDIRFESARQANLGGTGIGSFSDRMRDFVRGGGPFDSPTDMVERQGFVSGWFYDPNASPTYIWENGPINATHPRESYRVAKGSAEDREFMIAGTDNIRVWLAGGLATYRFQDAAGAEVAGQDVPYPVAGNPGAQPSGYTSDPQEAINYADKHDNLTFWDYSELKIPPGTSSAVRVRAHNVGNALLILAQGIPFLHAGTDILRSKSGDRDSYDSGDWHNELDWTLSGSKWAQGLPIADKNSSAWPILRSAYLDPTTHPGTTDLQRAFDHMREMLQIRKSSPLFRLRDKDQVDQRVKFYNTGPSQIPGVIAMAIDGCAEPGNVPADGALMTIFNASDEPRTLNLFGTETWTLHPVLVNSTDPIVRTAKHDANGFYVPARTTAVFRRAEQKSCAPYPVDMYVRGSFNDWADPPKPEYKLEFLGGKDYSVSAPVTLPATGKPAFKIAAANWSAAATDCGVAPDTNAWLGQPLTLTCGKVPGFDSNINLQASVAGNYKFSLNAASTVNPVLTVARVSPSNDQTLYVRGGFNNWDTSLPTTWDDESIYTGVGSIAAGTFEFKVEAGNWATLDCGGPRGAANGSTKAEIGQPLALTCGQVAGQGPSNLGLTVPSAGQYVFAVDATDQAALKLVVEPAPVTDTTPDDSPDDTNVFVRGLGGDWSRGPLNQMNYLGFGTYRLDKVVSAGAQEFKIATADWAKVNCGWATKGQQVAIGTPFAMACPGAENLVLSPTIAGTYRFKYTKADGNLLVTGP